MVDLLPYLWQNQNERRYESNRKKPPDDRSIHPHHHLHRPGTSAGTDPQKQKVNE